MTQFKTSVRLYLDMIQTVNIDIFQTNIRYLKAILIQNLRHFSDCNKSVFKITFR